MSSYNETMIHKINQLFESFYYKKQYRSSLSFRLNSLWPMTASLLLTNSGTNLILP